VKAVRRDFGTLGLFVTFFALSACDSTAPIAPLPEDAAPDAPTSDALAFDASTPDAPGSDAPESDVFVTDAPESDGTPPDAPASDGPASDAPTSDASAVCSGLDSPNGQSVMDDVAWFCAHPLLNVPFAQEVGNSTNTCAGLLAVARTVGVNTVLMDLFDPTTGKPVERLSATNGNSACLWSATGLPRDLGTCWPGFSHAGANGWNLQVACATPPFWSGDAATDAGGDATAD
jgi:hypothetical protein